MRFLELSDSLRQKVGWQVATRWREGNVKLVFSLHRVSAGKDESSRKGDGGDASTTMRISI